MRLRLVLLGLLLIVTAAGCSLLPAQEPYDPADDHVVSYRGGRYWMAPGGFGPEFWSRFK
jgi:hypothetical protein